MKRLLICLFLSPLILCGCTRHLVSEDIPDQTPIDASVIEEFDFAPIEASTEEEYVEAAKAAGYVVNETTLNHVYGEDIMEDFYNTSMKGTVCRVGIVDHVIEGIGYLPAAGEAGTTGLLPEYSAELYITQLVYDGDHYRYDKYKWGSETPVDHGEFKYLVKYEGEFSGMKVTGMDSGGLVGEKQYGYEYILVNDDTLTWDEIWARNLTSYTKDNVANHSVLLVLNKQERK